MATLQSCPRLCFCMVFYIYFLYGGDFVQGCSHSKPARVQEHRSDVSEASMMSLAFLNRECNIRRRVSPGEIEDDTWRLCDTYVPGIGELAFGQTPSHFATNGNDEQPRHKRVLTLTCNNAEQRARFFSYSNNGNISRYPVPNEVDDIEMSPQTLVDQYNIVPRVIINAIINDTTLSLQENKYIGSLPLLDLHSRKDDLSTTAYLSVQVRIYQASLRRTVVPTDELLHDFEELPSNWTRNPNGFSTLVETYGTHVLTAGEFGGTFMSLGHRLDIENAMKTEEEILQSTPDVAAPYPNNNEITRTKTSVNGGNYVLKMPVNRWIATLPNSPVLIKYKAIPLYKFLEPDTFTERSKSLKKMIGFYEEHNEIKRVKYSLGVLPHNTKIAAFLNEVLSDELTFLCKSPEVMDLIQSGIIYGKNPLLTRYSLNVTYSEYDNGRALITPKTIHYVLPYVCYSKETNRVATLVTHNMPFTCFKFFSSEKCQGTEIGFAAKSRDLLGLWNRASSFRPCTPEEQSHIVPN